MALPPGAVIEPGHYKILFADNQPGQSTATEWHTNFRLNSGGGSLALARIVDGAPQILDYLNYGPLLADHAYGSCPDGQLFDRDEIAVPTPGAANHCDLAPAPVAVFINEWMASNTNNLADPADGKFDDWFELYNAGTTTVDLAGYYLTDNLAKQTQYQIPPGYSILPHGHLLVWADNQTNQNSAAPTDLHANFQLAKGGEAIGLFAPDGVTPVDYVIFGPQTNDVSQGRCPDGSANIVFFAAATPRTANLCPPSGPSFASIAPAANGAIALVFPRSTAGCTGSNTRTTSTNRNGHRWAATGPVPRQPHHHRQHHRCPAPTLLSHRLAELVASSAARCATGLLTKPLTGGLVAVLERLLE